MATYHIKQGNHYCEESTIKSSPIRQTIKFKFFQDCLYNESSLPFSGWNKLWGFGDLFGQNSNRIGWACKNGTQIILCQYTHLSGDYYTTSLGVISTGVEYYAEIYWENGKYKIDVFGPNDLHYSAQQIKSRKPFWQIQHFPYFGGNSFAPHDMTIEITTL